MAEAVPETDEDPFNSSETKDKTVGDSLECAICLQPCVHPAQLPCGHIFCFLCVKGIANQSKKCAMCRQEIPRNFIDQPNLLDKTVIIPETDGYDGGYEWFYEGRNGWWQYDERTSNELESAYKNGEKITELLIAGFLYIIDLENMLQLRRNDPSRRRNIKRDLSSIPKKGIAGLRTAQNTNFPLIEENSTGPVAPSNSPQSSASGRESPNDDTDLIDRMDALTLETE